MVERKYHQCSRRGRQSSDWSQLVSDISESILRRLSLANVIRFQTVCSSWCCVAQAYMSSPSRTPFLEAPWLMLNADEDEGSRNNYSFFSLEEKRVFKLKTMREETPKGYCMGSSHGWLVLVDQNADPYLLNPLSGAQIQLPGLRSFPSVVDINHCAEGGLFFQFRVGNCVEINFFESMKELQEKLYYGVVLSLDPSQNSNYVVVVLYYYGRKLSFCKSGDETWTDLSILQSMYCAITYYNDELYALTEDGKVEVWDLRNSLLPVKRMDVGPNSSFPTHTDECYVYNYLVALSGHLFLVVRCVDYGSRVRRVLFTVYKLDFEKMEWIEVESLGDSVLFLDVKHALSLQSVGECQKNSIYFLDCYAFEQIVRRELCLFKFEDKSISSICHWDSGYPFWDYKPYWVVPNPQ